MEQVVDLLVGRIDKTKDGYWIIEYLEGGPEKYFKTIYPLVPWIEIEEGQLMPYNRFVAFRPVLHDGRIYADL